MAISISMVSCDFWSKLLTQTYGKVKANTEIMQVDGAAVTGYVSQLTDMLVEFLMRALLQSCLLLRRYFAFTQFRVVFIHTPTFVCHD